MAVQLNHTIVNSSDKQRSARLLAELLDLPDPVPYGPFLGVQVSNDVTLDFFDAGTVHPQHYAFLVGEDVFGRIKQRGLPYWADPHHTRPNEHNTNDGGRGVYWDDPDGHVLEIITVPYGG
jgi:hypothetical protein